MRGGVIVLLGEGVWRNGIVGIVIMRHKFLDDGDYILVLLQLAARIPSSSSSPVIYSYAH